jgi:hypothetical protein
MELKVRAIGDVEEKSVQEREQELLDNHEARLNQTDEESTTESGLSEEDVLSFIKNRYNREIGSVDELFSQREANEDMPEDVSAFLQYKKETGRGIEDFMKVQKNLDESDDDELLSEYLLASGEAVDPEDVDLLMEDYRYDEDLDDESSVRRVKLKKKKAVAKAREYFKEQQAKYKAPLESSGAVGADAEEFQAFKQYLSEAKTLQEQNERRAQWYQEKTNEVFTDKFEGFEFKVGDSSLKFAPAGSAELKKAALEPGGFINKYLDEQGLIKDANGYHRALSVAMDPDRFAKFFYEQGKAEAVNSVSRQSKNINMETRRATELSSPNGLKVRAMNSDSGRGLKIKKR